MMYTYAFRVPRRRKTLNDKSLAFRMPRCRQTLNDERSCSLTITNFLTKLCSYLERNMANNDEAWGSGGKEFWELSQEMEEQPHLYEDAAFPTDPETTDGAAEDDPTDATTDGAAEDATTDDVGACTDGSQKRQRKDRRPTVLPTLKEEVTEVDSDGNPMAPARIVKGYSLQLGCILRSTVSINTENLRHPDRGNLRNLLFTKLHERYKFPAEFENTSLKGNKVN